MRQWAVQPRQASSRVGPVTGSPSTLIWFDWGSLSLGCRLLCLTQFAANRFSRVVSVSSVVCAVERRQHYYWQHQQYLNEESFFFFALLLGVSVCLASSTFDTFTALLCCGCCLIVCECVCVCVLFLLRLVSLCCAKRKWRGYWMHGHNCRPSPPPTSTTKFQEEEEEEEEEESVWQQDRPSVRLSVHRVRMTN